MRVKALVLVAVTLILVANAWAGSETILYNFCSQTSCVDGYLPYGSLVADSSGNHLYGTTYEGGAHGFGEVFELTNSGGTWTQSVIYNFNGASNGDGAYPHGGLVFDTAGNLYGTTYQGGASSQGSVYELSKSGSTWTETVLHTFDDISGSDGYYPYSTLAIDAAGNLYGTTQAGGKLGGGTVFELKASNGGKYTYKVIHGFTTSSSSAYTPYAGVIVNSKNGYLYGTTFYGGTVWNAGAVYQLRQVSGVWIFSVIYNFLGDSLGQYTEAALTIDGSGNLYGTTYQGGDFNLGEVFKLTPSGKKWTEKVIYSFKGYAKKDGAYPYFAGVTIDSAGNLYGSTYQGGSSAANNLNYGTVYKLAANTYKESVLWSFGTSGDGYNPYRQAIVVNGKVYGTTNVGGSHGGGIVYEVKP
jgi:uncharacterized repeat protein (TIGR03803 family)